MLPRKLRMALAISGIALLPCVAFAQSMSASTDPMVGGAAMYPSRNIVQNALNSKDHTTLVAAVKAAGLVPTLEGNGPFTVFAPTNEAFAALPAGTVQTFLKPENKAELVKILTYHVVPGRYTEADIENMIQLGGGKAQLKTVEGEMLMFSNGPDGGLTVMDAKGDAAKPPSAMLFSQTA